MIFVNIYICKIFLHYIDRLSETNNINESESQEIIEDDDHYDPNATVETIDGEFLPRHLRCASHTLNLIATTDAEKVIQDNLRLRRAHEKAIFRCETLWRAMRAPKKREALKTYLNCSLKRPVITRWNSYYDALRQIASLQDKLMHHHALQGIIDTKCLPRSEDYRYINEYLLCLQPLATAIDILQGDKECHYGFLLPTLISLTRK